MLVTHTVVNVDMREIWPQIRVRNVDIHSEHTITTIDALIWAEATEQSMYRWLRNLYCFLEFVESLTKISGKSSKVQNKKTEIVKSILLPSLMS